MNEHDVVRVKETVMATPDFEDEPIEIEAGWRGSCSSGRDEPSCMSLSGGSSLGLSVNWTIGETQAQILLK